MAMSDQHHHGEHHGHEHATMALAPFGPRRPVHRIGRRQFLTDLGRGTFAVAVLGVPMVKTMVSSGSSRVSPVTLKV